MGGLGSAGIVPGCVVLLLLMPRFPDIGDPRSVVREGLPDGQQVGFSGTEHVNDAVQSMGDRCARCSGWCCHGNGFAKTSQGDCGFARENTHPAGKGEGAAFKCRLHGLGGSAVKHVHSHVAEGLEKVR